MNLNVDKRLLHQWSYCPSINKFCDSGLTYCLFILWNLSHIKHFFPCCTAHIVKRWHWIYMSHTVGDRHPSSLHPPLAASSVSGSGGPSLGCPPAGRRRIPGSTALSICKKRMSFVTALLFPLCEYKWVNFPPFSPRWWDTVFFKEPLEYFLWRKFS